MQKLPADLKKLVHDVVAVLGTEINNLYGEDLFILTEEIRLSMKKGRVHEKMHSNEITKTYHRLEKLHPEDLKKITHIFSIYLELVNHCESAYRSVKLKSKKYPSLKKKPSNLIYVFTAHPTESRSPNSRILFHQINSTIQKIILSDFGGHEEELSFQIKLLLATTLSNQNKPTLLDEANHIFSTILSDVMLESQIRLKNSGSIVRYRAWIGGDKDGHPFVDENTTRDSLSISRFFLIRYIIKILESDRTLINQLDESDFKKSVTSQLTQLDLILKNIEKIQKNDFINVQKFIKEIHSSNKEKIKLSAIKKIMTLIELYPALVVPLEFREDASFIHQALKDPNENIARMIRYLGTLGDHKSIHKYVRGFIVSMTESVQDLFAARDLQIALLGKVALPVVPLFEKKESLEKSLSIISDFLNGEINNEYRNKFGSMVEIMLGYSDSSKESGVLESRWLIANTLDKLDRFLRKNKFIPIFFHGSGGSIERGGGSVREQTQWWPTSALNNYKVTIQGEMVERNFSDPLIMESHVHKIIENFSTRTKASRKIEASKEIAKLASKSSALYTSLLKNPAFVRLVKEVTPYNFLDELKIGSRPSKRTTQGEELKLRAIPWVLCWTQTRTLLPTWYGIGTAFQSLSKVDKQKIISTFKTSHFLRSYIKILGFTLAKVELEIFRHYVHSLTVDPELHNLFEDLAIEFQLVKKFFKSVTRSNNFLWYRPWLLESIDYRSAMIHPLNLIQILAIKRRDNELLRETVSGIACGMMTTG